MPLLVDGASIGALSVIMGDSGRVFEDGDYQLARELASRIALAIDHARRFSAEREARERAERAEAQAAAAARSKDAFLAILGHELRNPLAPIMTALALMSRTGPDARAREIIERQTRHLTRLVDDLLDVSGIARGKVELQLESLELAELTRAAVEIVAPSLALQRHHLEVSVPAGLSVRADATRLLQIVVNLLANAIKYTPPGGQIAVVAERVGAMIAYRVVDSGVGIAPDMLDAVFEMFTQAEQSLARTQGGLGLGLTIVRSLVIAHGGTVVARSAGLGHGTELELMLPAASEAPVIAAPSAPVAAAPTRRRRVVIVDDNPDAAELLTVWLQTWGFEVRSAHDGEQALALIAAFEPEVAVLDIGLPVIDGYELARQLRAIPAHASMRLIALTGYGQASDKARARAAGFDDHLVKPASPDRVRALIDR